MHPNNKTPAVVMGLTATGLAVARSLGRKGVPVIGLAPSLSSVGTKSKYIKYIECPRIEDEEALLSLLLEIAASFEEKPVLLPTGDRNVLFMAGNRAVLKEKYHFVIPDHETLLQLSSKKNLIKLSEQIELPLPRTIEPQNIQLIKEQIEYVGLPCVVKPEFTHLWQQERAAGTKCHNQKAILVNTLEELLDLYEDIKKVDSRIIVQQAILGPDENHLSYHAFVDSQGTLHAEFIGSKLRLTPPFFGMGCYVESVWSDRVKNTGRGILKSLNYHGMANINFKINSKDNQLYMFEINPRFSFWTGLDVSCGIDFPYYYYSNCIGQPFAPSRNYPTGKRWINLEADLGSMLTYSKKGTWSWWRWATWPMYPTVGAVWAWDDMKPGLMVFSRLTKLLSEKLARLCRK